MIPYTVERRPDTRVTNVTLGVWLFLASEAMLFGGLFSAYALLRVAAPEWPSGPEALSLVLGLTNTVVLMTMTALAWRAGRLGDARGRRLLAASSALGLVFLVIKGLEWQGEISAGLVPATNTFLALYFTLTGLHALHVAGGLAANAWAIAGRAGPAMTAGRLHALALYWAFVDVIWVIILVLFYLS